MLKSKNKLLDEFLLGVKKLQKGWWALIT
jgi:hypothetical protein